MQKGRKRNGCSFILWAFPLSVLVILVISIGLVTLVVSRDYKAWEKSFEGSHLSTDYVLIDDKEINVAIEKKVETFAQSRNEIDYIELNQSETVFVLGDSLKRNIPTYLGLNRGWYETDKGRWKMFYEVTFKDFVSIWFMLDIRKDSGEGTGIYVNDIFLGNYSFREYGLRSLVNKVDDGMREAISIVNQPTFSGRRIINIELDSRSVVIKGKL